MLASSPKLDAHQRVGQEALTATIGRIGRRGGERTSAPEPPFSSETARLARTEQDGSLWLAGVGRAVYRHDPAEFHNLFHASRIQSMRLT